MNNISTDKLVSDMRAVIVDAEELMKATANQTGERIEKIRARTEGSLRNARERLQVAGDDLALRAEAAIGEADNQVRTHPYTTAGVAAGIGLLVGILIGRTK
jgi:ElaB/YqjD/DUF883 family membrane-anchored ribosome-binding protein